eukprot:scaffold2086_cov159-Chaetoceros_neogracile.AAC.4
MDDKNSNLAKDNTVSMKDLFKGKKVAVFGVPAPFTGTCTTAHYPPYKALADEFKTKGVDNIVCYSVTDPYAHYNWGQAMDVDCEWAKENDLNNDYTAASLGHRSARFSMLVDDEIMKTFNMVVEEADQDAQTLLSQVRPHNDEIFLTRLDFTGK